MSRVIDGKEQSGQFLDDFWIEYNELVLKNTELSGAERKEKKNYESVTEARDKEYTHF